MKQLMTLFNMTLVGCLVSGCQLSVPNIEVCRDKGALGAHCAHTNDNQIRDIPFEEWQDVRFGQFCMVEEDFAKNQKFVEQACQMVNKCDVEKLIKAYESLRRNLK